MENVQMLVPTARENFWKLPSKIVEEVLTEDQVPRSKNHADRPLLKAKELCEFTCL